MSDHFDGRHFFNPAAPAARGLPDVLRWRLTSRPMPWPAALPPERHPPPPSLVPAGSVAATFVNHATFLLRFAGATVLTDPIWSERCSPLSFVGPKRVRPPGMSLDELPHIDVILLSHNHYDHMDLPSLRELQRRSAPKVVTMLGNAAPLRRLGLDAVELDWWQQTVRSNLEITATPARHFAARTPWDRNRTLWGGFSVKGGGVHVLFAGDSATGPHWAAIRVRLGAPDLALLPIGAYEPRWFMSAVHMNPEEAVRAHRDLDATRSLGMHFGTFRLTDEAIDAPVHALHEAATAAGLAPGAFTTLGVGETVMFARHPTYNPSRS